MYLVFIGPPGAGKGTQSKLLVGYLCIPHLSTGDLLRQACADETEVGEQAKAYLEAGELIPDPLMMQVVQQRLAQPDCADGCLFDGFPRTLHQAQSLGRLLHGRGTPLDVVLELRVDDKELTQRLDRRGRSDDRPEIYRQRLKTYYQSAQELLDFYHTQGLLKTIDGRGSTDEVFERIRQALPKKSESPARRRLQSSRSQGAA